MTLQHGGEQPQAEVTALLRAVGQLLVAISGDEAAPAAQSTAPAEPPARTAPPMEEIEQILADARARAQQLIDESFAEARDTACRQVRCSAGSALRHAPSGCP